MRRRPRSGDGRGAVGRSGAVPSPGPPRVVVVVCRWWLVGLVVVVVAEADAAAGSGAGTAGAGGTATAAAAAVAAEATPQVSNTSGCARRLFTHPDDFAPCAAGATCFFFLHEEPFARGNPLPPGAARHDIRIPFPCEDHGLYGQDGLAWALYDELVPNPTDLCAYGGDKSECSFNDLIQLVADSRDQPDHPGFGKGLALHGAWVLSEERAYLASASDAFIENQMVLVRNKDDGGFQTPSMSRFSAVIRPFAGETWALLVCVVATYVVILLVLSTVGPAPVHRRLPPRLWLLRLVSNFAHLITGTDISQDRLGLAVGLVIIRGVLALVFIVFLAFYEAALILGKIPSGLAVPVSGLTDLALCRWTVFGGGARETLLMNMVNRGRSRGRWATRETRTWSTCASVAECLQQVATAAPVNNTRCARAPTRRVEVLLSWKSTIIAELRRDRSLCAKLEVADAEEDFFTFGMGWYFADVSVTAPNVTRHLATWTRRRQDINAAFRRGRMTHAISRVVEREVGLELPCEPPDPQVRAGVIYVPVLVLIVLGVAAAVVVHKLYLLANHTLREADADADAGADADADAEAGAEEQRVAEPPPGELPRRRLAGPLSAIRAAPDPG